jgi:S-formylglutathione hydrolase FrmB
MPYIRLGYASEALNRTTEISVFFPGPPPRRSITGGMEPVMTFNEYDKRNRYQVLYLLHGGMQNHLAWPLQSMIMDKCNFKQLVVVMISNRDCLDTMAGADYLKFMGEELPEFLRFLFPISSKKEDTFIAGLSYGGYFSYRVALNYPDNYGCCGSFASPIDVVMDLQRMQIPSPDFCKYYEIAGTNKDVLGLAKQLKESGRAIPKMFQACGTEDFTWDFNVSARDFLRSLDLDHTWAEGPGVHNFEFWDPTLKKFLEWLPLKGLPYVPSEEAEA